jgi:hypothetical protein
MLAPTTAAIPTGHVDRRSARHRYLRIAVRPGVTASPPGLSTSAHGYHRGTMVTSYALPTLATER